jgi:hypothetical protein
MWDELCKRRWTPDVLERESGANVVMLVSPNESKWPATIGVGASALQVRLSSFPAASMTRLAAAVVVGSEESSSCAVPDVQLYGLSVVDALSTSMIYAFAGT